MTMFQYRGRTGRGDLVSGELEADSADAVANQLFNTGITPIDVTVAQRAQAGALDELWQRLGASKPTLDDILHFTRQMYALTRSGVPLIRGLTGISDSSHNMAFKQAIHEVINALESGRDLAGSLARHPEIFSPLYINIIRVGESSGKLEEAFERLYSYLQLERETRQRVKSAVRYPIFVVFAIAAAIAVITIWVIPVFAHVFAQFHAQLPLPTRIILAVSNFARAYWPAVLVAIIGAILGARAYVRTETGRYRWDKRKITFPVIGSILFKSSLARYARAFAMTYRAGVPLIEGLTLVARAVDNQFLADRILNMRNGVERGESLFRTSAATGVFTPLVLQMVSVGEETGAMDSMLEEVAIFYEGEVDYELKRLGQSIEPILIVSIGIMVLILALGVFLPMWDLAQVAHAGR